MPNQRTSADRVFHALADTTQTIEYPSLLGMERSRIRSYPPETVIAEKFQAVVALGSAHSRVAFGIAP